MRSMGSAATEGGVPAADRMVAFVFPGQGSQYPGMGRELAERYPEAREVFREADDALGFPLSRLCFEGPEDELSLTMNTQPAVLTVSVAMLAVLEARGARPAIVCGHSLGEYSALVAARALSLGTAVRLVRARGELMQQAVAPGAGTMAAVIGLARERVADACRRAAGSGHVEPANYNAPDQVVISGDPAGVRRAAELCLEDGARRVIPLRVSGPFHSRLMESAARAFRAVLAGARISQPIVPVVSNVDASLVRSAEAARASLADQMCSPVLWEECVRAMWDSGARTFVEVGPGRTLTSLVKRILPEAAAFAAEAGAVAVDGTLEFLEGVR